MLLTIGRTNIGFVKDGIAEYTKRLKHYMPFRIEELPDVKIHAKRSEPEQKNAEGEMILSKLQQGDHVVLLDERGREYRSIEFAERLQRIMAGGFRRCVFVVGGPFGFSKSVYDRADEMLSLSKMTFNHEMVRLFFTEQIYRAMTILRNEPYHHE